MIGVLGEHFKGGMPIPHMMKMVSSELRMWYKIYEKQMAQKAVINEYSNKNKEIPKGIAFLNKVKSKIAEWNNVNVEE